MDMNMTGVTALAMIAGVVVPFVTALFTNPVMTPAKKRLISGGVAVVFGLLSAIITGQLGWIPPNIVAWVTTFVVSVGVVIAAAQGFYKQFKGAVESLEFATTKTSYVPEIEPSVPDPVEEVGDDEIVVEEDEAPEGEER